MQWLHASFGVGITLGPIIMTTAVNGFGQWRLGYLVVGVAQITLATCFFLTAGMWQQDVPAANAESSKLTDYKTPLRASIRQPGLWFSVLLFLFTQALNSHLAIGHTLC